MTDAEKSEPSEPVFTDTITVELVQQEGGDASVVAAARISTQGADVVWDTAVTDEKDIGLIRYLMANRHGTPFEHNLFSFRVHAPIFVFREHHRHRIAWSYNEESGRYTQLEPVFYIPGRERNLVQIGKPGAYEFVPGTEEQYYLMRTNHVQTCLFAYATYTDLLNAGIAREVARMSLPVNIYSSMWATTNARAIMAFLGLRTNRLDATFPSKPMREIEMVADQIERYFARAMPITHEAFETRGRVSP